MLTANVGRQPASEAVGSEFFVVLVVHAGLTSTPVLVLVLVFPG